MQIDKSDRNDAAGIARMMQTGWYREVRVKFMTVPGVGPMTAVTVRSFIGQWHQRAADIDKWPDGFDVSTRTMVLTRSTYFV